MTFKNAVCRGSMALKNNCGHCERCDLELRKFQAANAEKSDAHQLEMFEVGMSYAKGGLVGNSMPSIIGDEVSEYVIPADKLGKLASNLGPILTGSLKVGNVERFASGDVTIHDQKHASPIKGHSGLPVAGYAPVVEQWRVDMINENKIAEEKALRRVDEHVREHGSREIDQASVQLARRHIEDAFYRLNRAIMQPKRILGDLK